MNTRKVLDKAVQKRDSWIYVRELYHDFYLDKFRIIRSNCKINTNTKFWTKVSKKETREYERSWIIPRFLSRPKFQYNSKFFRIVKLTPLIRIQNFGQSCPKKRRVNMNVRELYHDFYFDLSFTVRSNCKINTNTKFWTKLSKKETREYERSWII